MPFKDDIHHLQI